MSTMINMGPMITKVVRDMLEDQGTILDVDSVYAQMVNIYGNQIFESERMLAQVAVRQKIKSHLKSSHSINDGNEQDQLRLLKDDAPATLSVKQAGGGYAYIPLRLAGLEDLDAATKAKKENISNATAALRRWTESIKPIRKAMIDHNISFGEAQRVVAEEQKAEKATKRKTRSV